MRSTAGYCPKARIGKLIVSGGGARNPLIMAQLAAALPDIEIVPSDAPGRAKRRQGSLRLCAPGERDNSRPPVESAQRHRRQASRDPRQNLLRTTTLRGCDFLTFLGTPISRLAARTTPFRRMAFPGSKNRRSDPALSKVEGRPSDQDGRSAPLRPGCLCGKSQLTHRHPGPLRKRGLHS